MAAHIHKTEEKLEVFDVPKYVANIFKSSTRKTNGGISITNLRPPRITFSSREVAIKSIESGYISPSDLAQWKDDNGNEHYAIIISEIEIDQNAGLSTGNPTFISVIEELKPDILFCIYQRSTEDAVNAAIKDMAKMVSLSSDQVDPGSYLNKLLEFLVGEFGHFKKLLDSNLHSQDARFNIFNPSHYHPFPRALHERIRKDILKNNETTIDWYCNSILPFYGENVVAHVREIVAPLEKRV